MRMVLLSLSVYLTDLYGRSAIMDVSKTHTVLHYLITDSLLHRNPVLNGFYDKTPKRPIKFNSNAALYFLKLYYSEEVGSTSRRDNWNICSWLSPLAYSIHSSILRIVVLLINVFIVEEKNSGHWQQIRRLKIWRGRGHRANRSQFSFSSTSTIACSDPDEPSCVWQGSKWYRSRADYVFYYGEPYQSKLTLWHFQSATVPDGQ